ncbi:MAG TPA: hypothetical protein DCR40_08895 [Prolixibacteraceae bacterium]|nr:hypothetical protein [Prolixibacteraceae bacterium]
MRTQSLKFLNLNGPFTAYLQDPSPSFSWTHAFKYPNPDYWDRSLPKSTVRFLTMYYHISSGIESEEYIRNNNHQDYPGMFMEKMDVSRLGILIRRK